MALVSMYGLSLLLAFACALVNRMLPLGHRLSLSVALISREKVLFVSAGRRDMLSYAPLLLMYHAYETCAKIRSQKY